MAVQTVHRSAGRRYGPTALSRSAQTVAAGGAGGTRGGVVRSIGRAGQRGDMAPRRADRDSVVARSWADPAPAREQRVADPGSPAPAGRPGARYPRVPDARRARPASGAVAHRNRVTVPSCPPGSAASGYRMGRWARLAMTVVVTAAVVVGALTLVRRPTSVPTRFVTVQPGDTLASIATRALPGLDGADAIAVIESLNGLDGPAVQVGAVLRVPAGDGNP